MKEKNKSVFNLIEIFTKTKKIDQKTINTESHCDEKHHHDFYCDSEQPFIAQ